MAQDRLIVIDGYNLIHRTPQLRPGSTRTLRESRDKLLNLLTWMMGGDSARFIVVFDGESGSGGRDGSIPGGRIDVRWSQPPENADLLIRRIVEDQMDRVDRLTVVTADLEVARHARAMGADISLSDLFLASALGAAKDTSGVEEDKPKAMSKAEVEQWAELFRSRPRARDEDDDEPIH